ncbi:AAA family ATPase [archaeon]|nr:AAA family ATPase [archaeon]
MSYFIIIRGPLGVGKSTIAGRLAKILDAEHVYIDKILEEQGLDKVDKNAGCIPVKNFIIADEIILPELRKKIKTGKIAIFDGCFYHKKHVEHIIKNLKCKSQAFTLKAPLAVCVQRDGRRKRKYGKEAAKAVRHLVDRFDYGIIIDTNHKTANQVVKEILFHLGN